MSIIVSSNPKIQQIDKMQPPLLRFIMHRLFYKSQIFNNIIYKLYEFVMSCQSDEATVSLRNVAKHMY